MGRGAARGEAALTAASRFRLTTLAHAGRDLLGPVSDTALDAMLDRLATALGATGGRAPFIVDVGCGKGVMLARALERLGGRGIGVEPNPAFAADARARLAAPSLRGRATIVEAELAGAALPDVAFTFAICTGALHAFGGWREALAGVRRLVAPGGHALLGPGYWRQRPAPAYLAAFGGEEGELESLPRTLTTAGDEGWRVLACRESTMREWDDYEHAYAARIREWCEAHPADPDAGPFRERIERWAAAYDHWGRDTMGYALVLLERAS